MGGMDVIADLTTEDVGNYVVALYNGSLYRVRIDDAGMAVCAAGDVEWVRLAAESSHPVFGDPWTIRDGDGRVIDEAVVVAIDRRD